MTHKSGKIPQTRPALVADEKGNSRICKKCKDKHRAPHNSHHRLQSSTRYATEATQTTNLQAATIHLLVIRSVPRLLSALKYTTAIYPPLITASTWELEERHVYQTYTGICRAVGAGLYARGCTYD